MQRLVYSPKAYAFTKNSVGDILNLTDYITSGECQRLVNQASTASLTLRNPDRIFTIPARPAFHPMDAVTIFLERIKGYPIQVFTGYLDDTPYYQMYPGTVTLQATCTLKRLMYTYFDPSLPYVNAFFASYGWINSQDGTLKQMSAMANQSQVGNGSNNNTNNVLQDGSIGKLLYATLTDIGEWDDTHIWIENIPSGEQGLGARIAKLMASLAVNQETAANEFTQFLDASLGSGSQGSGGSNGSGTESYGNAPKTPANGYTKATWAAALLSMLRITPTNNNMQALVGWMNAEGGNWSNNARYNPLNTTQGLPGASSVNSVGVKSYGSWAQGLVATAQTMTNGHYGPILSSLQSGTPADIAAAIGSSPWGTGATLVAQTISSAPTNLGGTKVPGVSTTNSARTTALENFGAAKAGQLINRSGSNSGTTTVIDAMISAAATINNKHLPYVWGGGHSSAGTPSGGTSGSSHVGFDCSGSVAAVLSASGVIKPGSSIGNDASLVSQLQSAGVLASGPATGSPAVNLYDYPGAHIYMSLNGKNFGTYGGGGGGLNNQSPGGGWLPDGAPPPSVEGAAVSTYHILPSVLNQSATYTLSLGNTSNTSSSGSPISRSTAEAFTAEVSFPSVQDMTTAILLGQEGKGLMHDEQLMPFVQQLAQASMRSFQSLPNGDFYAFYPDYFGEFDHHPPYWSISDIEVLTGDIYLNDSALVTHQYTVGDNTYPINNELFNQLFSSGVVTIYNAFTPGLGIIEENSQTAAVAKKGGSINAGLANVMGQEEAVEFVRRYGARPQVSNYPQVRSTLFEMYLAYQQFMLSWANQFRTPFSFTFMPEIYPGGKVEFPEHGIQMYVNSVTHSWDYTEGFTTDAVLMAPAQMKGSTNPDIPPNMVEALVGPIRASADITKKNKSAQTKAQDNSVGRTVSGTQKKSQSKVFNW